MALRDAEMALHDAEIVLRGAEMALHDAEIVLRGTETPVRGAEIRLRGTKIRLCRREIWFRSTETGLQAVETGYRLYKIRPKSDLRKRSAVSHAHCGGNERRRGAFPQDTPPNYPYDIDRAKLMKSAVTGRSRWAAGTFA